MKGRILGFDAATGAGAVNGEDGNRYSFASGDYKGPRAAAAGEDVDFVVKDGKATEIYPLKSGASIDLSGIGAALGGAASSPGGANVMGIVRNQPQTLLALIMLIAVFFMPFVQMSMGPLGSTGTTVLGLPSQVELMKPALQGTANTPDAQIAQMAEYSPEMAIQTRAARDSARSNLMVSNLIHLVWLLPAGSAWLMFTNLTNKRNQLHELIVGGLGIAAVLLFFFGKSMVIGQVGGMGQEAAAMASAAIQLGFGGWLIGLAGAGLVATGLGIVKQTPGMPAG
ncbi:MAG: hypothetical protein ABL883_02815 [Terricaulis sp.]